jgi:hypothetical protein
MKLTTTIAALAVIASAAVAEPLPKRPGLGGGCQQQLVGH